MLAPSAAAAAEVLRRGSRLAGAAHDATEV
jgi:hypothetical protein